MGGLHPVRAEALRGAAVQLRGTIAGALTSAPVAGVKMRVLVSAPLVVASSSRRQVQATRRVAVPSRKLAGASALLLAAPAHAANTSSSDVAASVQGAIDTATGIATQVRATALVFPTTAHRRTPRPALSPRRLPRAQRWLLTC
jgi:hypothetical protein